MEKYIPTATLFLDTRKKKANNKYPLKLTIYFRPKKRRYKTDIDLTADEWLKISSSRLKDEELKEKKIKAQIIVAKAGRILEKLEPFSFTAFENAFYTNGTTQVDLSLKAWFQQYINRLEKEGREGTRISYNTTLNSFLNFKENLYLTDVTKEFLEEYESSMLKRGKSNTTIGIYLRQLRTIVNQAIEKGILKQEHYPFKSFDIPGSRNIKKALNDKQLQAILNYQATNERHKKAIDFWIFSYLCNGMNFTDIAYLKPTNLNGSFLYFTRQKTIRTKKKDLRPIKVALPDRALDIIKIWKCPNPKEEYLFPILETGLSPKTVKHRIQRFIKWVNKAMEEIRQELNIESKCGTYVARHSFSSRLMRKGASTQLIKESLGHSSATVTENYLGDFEDNVKMDFANMLTHF